MHSPSLLPVAATVLLLVTPAALAEEGPNTPAPIIEQVEGEESIRLHWEGEPGTRYLLEESKDLLGWDAVEGSWGHCPATYEWTFSDFWGNTVTSDGEVVSYEATETNHSRSPSPGCGVITSIPLSLSSEAMTSTATTAGPLCAISSLLDRSASPEAYPGPSTTLLRALSSSPLRLPVSIDKEGLWLSRENEDHRVSLRRVELTQSSDLHSASRDFSGADLPSGSYSLTIRSAAFRHALTGGSLDANGDGRPWGDYELEFEVE